MRIKLHEHRYISDIRNAHMTKAYLQQVTEHQGSKNVLSWWI